MTPGERKARWEAALHEAGHAVAFARLCWRAASARVGAVAGGSAGHAALRWIPSSLADGVAGLAGPGAESLAARHAPPVGEPELDADGLTIQGDQARQLRDRFGETLGQAVADTLPPQLDDALYSAIWSLYLDPADPARWQRRWRILQTDVAEFLAAHETEIVAVARKLFLHGAATVYPRGEEPIIVTPAAGRSGDGEKQCYSTGETKMETMVDELQRKLAAAKAKAAQDYRAALTAAEPDLDKLLALATAGGIPPEQVKADVQAVDAFRNLSAATRNLAALRKAAGDAQAAVNTLIRRREDALAKFDTEAAPLDGRLYDARDLLAPAEEALAELRTLQARRPDLFSEGMLPAEARAELAKTRAQRDWAGGPDRRRVEAQERVYACRVALERAQRPNFDLVDLELGRPGKIKQAQAALAQAEADLAKATRAAESSRPASIPF